MQRRSFVVAVALAAGLSLGLVLGPVLGSATASAQTVTPTPGSGLWSQFLDKLAGTLNIQRTALDSAITSAGNSTADDAVKAGTLTQAQADALKARIQAGDLGALGGHGGRGGPGGKSRDGDVRQAMVDAAAKALGLTTTELTTQLRSGQTIAQLAQSKGTTEQAVVDAALAAAKTQLDQKVAAGTLTQAHADARYAELQQKGAQLFTPHERGAGRPAPATATPTAS